MIRRIYTFFAALLVRALVKYCTARGRYVDYVHSEPLPFPAYENFRERVYMRRYVITGFMTGDAHPNTLVDPLAMQTRPYALRTLWARARRAFQLSRWHLYLHHMHAPDADPCLHDHPWPWGLSFILLGGYTEQRNLDEPPKYAGTVGTRSYQAPALNRLSGHTFHRISELDMRPLVQQSGAGTREDPAIPAGPWGVFTLFLAGPRRASKPWGYLVPGRGFVPQRERHAEMGASERRAGGT